MSAVQEAFQALGGVAGDDGSPLVDSKGVDQRACAAWRDIMAAVQEEIVVWSRTHKRVHGTPAAMRPDRVPAPEVDDDVDLTAAWDRADEAA